MSKGNEQENPEKVVSIGKEVWDELVERYKNEQGTVLAVALAAVTGHLAGIVGIPLGELLPMISTGNGVALSGHGVEVALKALHRDDEARRSRYNMPTQEAQKMARDLFYAFVDRLPHPDKTKMKPEDTVDALALAIAHVTAAAEIPLHLVLQRVGSCLVFLEAPTPPPLSGLN